MLAYLCFLNGILVGIGIGCGTRYELSLVAVPANALYQAMKAVMVPMTPPARVTPTLPLNSPPASNKNVKNKKKNNEKNAQVDFMVFKTKRKVNNAHANKKKATALLN